MPSRARLTPMDVKTTFSALDKLVGDRNLIEIPVEDLPLERIRRNPRQPREQSSEAFTDSSIDELGESIKAHGVLQPILVRNMGRYFQIIAGERRYRACERLGLNSIPARVIDVESEEQEMELSLVENLQRKDLSPLEEAKIYQQMIEELGYTYRSLAERIGKSLGYIDTRIKLLAHDDVREAVQQLNIGVGEARELARVADDQIRQDLIRRVTEGSMDREDLQVAVKEVIGRAGSGAEGKQGYDASRLFVSRLRRLMGQAVICFEELESSGLGVEWDPGLLQLMQTVSERAGAVVEAAINAGSGELGSKLQGTPQDDARGGEEAGPETAVNLLPEEEEDEVAQEERKRAVEFVKSFRSPSNLCTLELIGRYWTALEHRGYTFHLGQWWARPERGSEWSVTLEFAIDGQQYTAEWICDMGQGTMLAANTPARILLGQRN